jgi:hypothetical protein
MFRELIYIRGTKSQLVNSVINTRPLAGILEEYSAIIYGDKEFIKAALSKKLT